MCGTGHLVATLARFAWLCTAQEAVVVRGVEGEAMPLVVACGVAYEVARDEAGASSSPSGQRHWE